MTTDLLNLFIYFGLFAIIILLLVDRWSLLDKADKEKERLLEELSKLNTALISKNANEYTMMRTMDKVVKEDKPAVADPDLVDETEMEDDDFYEALDKRAELAQ